MTRMRCDTDHIAIVAGVYHGRTLATKRLAMWYPIRLITLTALLSLTLQTVQAATATIERMSGSPKIFEIGAAGARQVSLPRPGGEYRLPIEVETGAGDSALFRLPDSEISVEPNSVMRIDAPEPRESGLFQRILQKAGTSFFSVDRRSVEHFEVRTPYLVSVVKGTIFNVVVGDDGATVALHEGRLLVSNPDGTQSVDLLPGDIAFSTATGEVRKLNRTMAARTATPDATPGELPASRRSVDASTRSLAAGIQQSGDVAAGDVASVARATVLPGAEGVSQGLVDTTVGSTLDTGGVVPQLDESVNGIVSDTGAVVSNVGAQAGDLVGDLGSTTGVLVSDLGSSTGGLVNDLTSTTGGLVGDVGSASGGLVGDVGSTAGDLVGAVSQPAGDLVADVGATTSEVIADVGSTTGNVVADLGSATADLTGGISSGTGDLTADLGSGSGDLLGDTAGALDATDITETLDELTGSGLGVSLPRLLP